MRILNIELVHEFSVVCELCEDCDLSHNIQVFILLFNPNNDRHKTNVSQLSLVCHSFHSPMAARQAVVRSSLLLCLSLPRTPLCSPLQARFKSKKSKSDKDQPSTQ